MLKCLCLNVTYEEVCEGLRGPVAISLVGRRISWESPRVRLKRLGFAGRVT